jgi:hypothetical protein
LDAVKKVREFMAYFNWQKRTPLPDRTLFSNIEEPAYAAGMIF